MLDMKNVELRYGGFKAAEGITLSVEEGSIVSLIGANGAGKSTIMRAVCGQIKPEAGDIIFMGTNITGKKPHDIVKLGLSMCPEGGRCFEHMTVRDNLLAGGYLAKSGRLRDKRLERIYQIFPTMKEIEGKKAGLLSGGQRQMLALGRGIMTGAAMLLCDEISLGLAPAVVRDIYANLKTVSEEGITLMIVDQDVSRSLSYSDYAYVLLEGRIVLQGKSKELDINDVNEAYFGVDVFSHNQEDGICCNVS